MGDTIVGRVAGLAFALAASLACASHATAQEHAVVHSPWTKFCGKENQDGKEVCMTVRETRQPDGRFVAGAALIEEEGKAGKILRFTLPRGEGREVRATLDQDQPIAGRYITCLPNGCMADVAVDAGFLQRLKAVTTLTVSSTDASVRTVTHVFPLAGFAEAIDGPPTDPKKFEVETKALSEELQKKADERRRMLERSGAPAAPTR